MIGCFTVIGKFVLIPMHTSPTNATKEIDELYDVFQDVRQRWKTEVRNSGAESTQRKFA